MERTKTSYRSVNEVVSLLQLLHIEHVVFRARFLVDRATAQWKWFEYCSASDQLLLHCTRGVILGGIQCWPNCQFTYVNVFAVAPQLIIHCWPSHSSYPRLSIVIPTARRAPVSPVTMKTCHQCHKRRSPPDLITCTNMVTGSADKVCTKAYCQTCLTRVYRLSWSYEQQRAAQWCCLHCRDQCICAPCKQQRRRRLIQPKTIGKSDGSRPHLLKN